MPEAHVIYSSLAKLQCLSTEVITTTRDSESESFAVSPHDFAVIRELSATLNRSGSYAGTGILIDSVIALTESGLILEKHLGLFLTNSSQDVEAAIISLQRRVRGIAATIKSSIPSTNRKTT